MGSRSVKLVKMAGQNIIQKKIFDSIDFYKNYTQNYKSKLELKYEELEIDEQEDIIATGYGKITINIEKATHISEIQAHVYGALFQSALKDFTLIDIGGQDTKIIKVVGGEIVDFLTNDKCAASSGRYLENMAQILDMSIEDLASYSCDAVDLSSTCAIFAESEIIGKIVEGHSVEKLAAGVNYALYKRFAPLIKKLLSEKIILSGGGSLGTAFSQILENELKVSPLGLAEAQFNAAIGCCVKSLYI